MDFEFDLEMLGIKDPVIKRRLIIPGDKTFMEFHYVLRVLFDWQSYHYFAFVLNHRITAGSLLI